LAFYEERSIEPTQGKDAGGLELGEPTGLLDGLNRGAQPIMLVKKPQFQGISLLCSKLPYPLTSLSKSVDAGKSTSSSGISANLSCLHILSQAWLSPLHPPSFIALRYSLSSLRLPQLMYSKLTSVVGHQRDSSLRKLMCSHCCCW
jgi:hypothetical protein